MLKIYIENAYKTRWWTSRDICSLRGAIRQNVYITQCLSHDRPVLSTLVGYSHDDQSEARCRQSLNKPHYRYEQFTPPKPHVSLHGPDSLSAIWLLGHIKNIHLHSCKHKTVKLTLTQTLTLTDTGGAVLTLMLGYRRLRNYNLKRKIQIWDCGNMRGVYS